MFQRDSDAIKIMSSADKSDDEKLLEVFQLYKDSLKENYPQLYYALLGWKDFHYHELNKSVYTKIDNSSDNIST